MRGVDGDFFESIFVVPDDKFFAAMLVDRILDSFAQYESCASDFTDAFGDELPAIELTVISRPMRYGLVTSSIL